MKPLKFKETNITFGGNQKPYIPLPAHKVKEPEGRAIFCMGVSFWERVKILFRGRIWVCLMTFNLPIQPSSFSVSKWTYFKKIK